jgi:citrate synthase
VNDLAQEDSMTAQSTVARGLEGIVSHETRLSDVDGERGKLLIGGYDVGELARHVAFEDVAHLLWQGDLPRPGEADAARLAMGAARRLPDPVLELLRGPAHAASGMHALRMATAALSISHPEIDARDVESSHRVALRITAQVPALVAHHWRIRNGQVPVDPPDHLGFAAGYLYMLEGREPEPGRVAALNAYMVAVVDHGMNASTFTARVIASTGSDMVSAVTGAVGALKGPLHGGVPGPVLEMLRDIGTPDRAEEWIRAALARGERIMGFGHRVYRVRDPRAEVLNDAAERLAQWTGDRTLLDLVRAVEESTVKVLGEVKPGRDLYANVELYAALVLHAVGIPSDLFTPTFAAARCAGWTAHVLEQMADNRLIRPLSVYVGPHDRRFMDVS